MGSIIYTCIVSHVLLEFYVITFETCEMKIIRLLDIRYLALSGAPRYPVSAAQEVEQLIGNQEAVGWYATVLFFWSFALFRGKQTDLLT